MTPTTLADRLNDALPQTQCTRCGYPDCRAYAEAVANDGAAINRCPPGGAAGIARLSAITGHAVVPLDPACGSEGPRALAVIDEAWCIGCTLCIKACPVDCIVGASKAMHTVIAPLCTGCELCLPVCPVDCIVMEPIGTATAWHAWSAEQAGEARERYAFHTDRTRRDDADNDARLEAKARDALADLAAHSSLTEPAALDHKRATVAAALQRARAKRDAGSVHGPDPVTPVEPLASRRED